MPGDGSSSANDMLRQLHLERVGRRKQAQGTSYTLCHSSFIGTLFRGLEKVESKHFVFGLPQILWR
jgi:hypothetical protein